MSEPHPKTCTCAACDPVWHRDLAVIEGDPA